MAIKPDLPPPEQRKLSNLALLWGFVRASPWLLTAALTALIIAASATLAVTHSPSIQYSIAVGRAAAISRWMGCIR